LNVGLSVSRVGGSAQTRAMKQVAGRLRLDLAQFRELAAFAQFGTSDLDRSTVAQLERGQRTTEILKQGQWEPISMEKQVMTLFAVTQGHMDDVTVPQVQSWEKGFVKFMDMNHPEIGAAIAKEKAISDATQTALRSAIADYKKTVSA